MNPDTGHLVKVDKEELKDLMSQGYQEVPESHKLAAEKKLSGKKEVYVSLKSGGKLSKLCCSWRRDKKLRRKKKLGTKEINRRRAVRREKNVLK